mmetsp:Transcript_3278/g.15514  ORF Transcript_3278/g.15514 Transcript_3278/m.15514 type:complete len:102 (+) Transcript_3278:293-598(+)
MSSPVRWIPRRWNGSVSSIKGLGPRESRRSGKAKARSIFAAKKLTESEYQNWIGARNQAKRTGKEEYTDHHDTRPGSQICKPHAGHIGVSLREVAGSTRWE